jgi:hypothetical protein
MTYLSDRERIERALPARLVWHVAKSIEDGGGQVDAILAGLEASFNATLEGLDDGARLKLARRLYRACQVVTSGLEDRPVATALVAAREMVFALIDDGLWEMDPDFDRAWDALATAIYEGDGNAELLETVDRSGTRYGRAALRRLQGEGYYRRAAVGVAA